MIKQKDIEAFRKHATMLRRILARIQKYHPEANYYLAMDGLNLMAGPSHDDKTENALFENSIAQESLGSAGGGDW